MRNTSTHLRRLKAGPPRKAAVSTRRKNFSPNISANYKMMLEIYYINKEMLERKDARFKRAGKYKPVVARRRPLLSLSAVVALFEESLSLLKKLRPKLAIASVTE